MINLYGTFNYNLFLKYKGGFNEKKFNLDSSESFNNFI